MRLDEADKRERERGIRVRKSRREASRRERQEKKTKSE